MAEGGGGITLGEHIPMARGFNPMAITGSRGGGAGGVELIEPTGGGGAQDIYRGGAVPNYVQMYSEAMRTALAPAQFMWGMYRDREELSAKQQELLMKGQELAATQQTNRIREEQEVARTNLEQLREAETERHNKAEETRQTQIEEWQKPLREAQAAEANALAAENKQKLEDLKEEADLRKNDRAAIDEMQTKLKEFGPEDHYDVQKNPEIVGIVEKAWSKIRSPWGKQEMSFIVGQDNALGQEIARKKAMTGWSKEAKDAFITNYNRWGQDPNAPDISGPERFNNAWVAGNNIQQMENEKNGYFDAKTGKQIPGWGDSAMAAYNKIKNDPANANLTSYERELKAMAAGRDEHERFQAQVKAKGATDIVKLKPTDISDMVDRAFPKKPGESNEEWETRKSPHYLESIRQEDVKPGGALEYLQGQTTKTPGVAPEGAPTESPQDRWARAHGLTPAQPPGLPPGYVWRHGTPTRVSPAPAAAPTPAPVITGTPAPVPPALGFGPTPAPTPAPAPTITAPTEVGAPLPTGTPTAQAGLLTPWDYWSTQFGQTETA